MKHLGSGGKSQLPNQASEYVKSWGVKFGCIPVLVHNSYVPLHSLCVMSSTALEKLKDVELEVTSLTYTGGL